MIQLVDIKTAFLNSAAYPKEAKPVYCRPPAGLDVAPGSLLRVLKPFYGFNDAPEEWRKQGPAAGRRVFKTHAVAALAPWRGGATEEGIPRGAGVIVVTRNPKDAAVSYFHHGRDTVQYKYTGDWAHFLHAIFLPGLVDFGDFWSWHGTRQANCQIHDGL